MTCCQRTRHLHHAPIHVIAYSYPKQHVRHLMLLPVLLFSCRVVIFLHFQLMCMYQHKNKAEPPIANTNTAGIDLFRFMNQKSCKLFLVPRLRGFEFPVPNPATCSFEKVIQNRYDKLNSQSERPKCCASFHCAIKYIHHTLSITYHHIHI
jgi:hypothetical protein